MSIDDIYARAELSLQQRTNGQTEVMIHADEMTALLQALSTNKIKLETQNEVLRQTQDAFAALKNRYFDLYNFTPVAYFTLNIQGDILETNLRATQLLGIKPYFTKNESLFSYLTKPSQSVFHQHIQTLCQQKNRQLCELEIICAVNKELLYVRVESLPILSGDNTQVDKIFTSFTDISDCKHAENLLRIQRDLSFNLITATDLSSASQQILEACCQIREIDCGGVYLSHPESGDLSLIAHTGLTDTFVAKTHYYPANSVEAQLTQAGHSLYAHFKDLPLARIACLASEGLQATAILPIQNEGKIIGAMQLASHIYQHISPNSRHAIETIANKIHGVIAHLSAEDANRRKLSAEIASRAKTEFIANMSHELRTPLNSLLILAEGLQEGTYGELNSRQQHFLHVIEESGRHLLSLINDILDLAKIEADKVELNLQLLAVEPVCQASLRLVRQMAHQKKQQLHFDIAEIGLMLYSDERRLKQILVNLLNNAIKFTPVKGTIGLKVHTNAAQKQIFFTVWDTGIGISLEDQKRLFTAFVQLNKKENKEYEGTGLGLNLVYHLVKLHGGSINVASEPLFGSHFIVGLPWQTDLEKQQTNTALIEQKHTVIRPATQINILLVEDNIITAQGLCDYLENIGYNVTLAETGTQALQWAQTQAPHLILLDIQLPELDGLSVTQQIRANVKTAHIPIVILTAMAMPGDREKCLAIGATDYLSKPITLKHLITMIERLCQT
ncbi:hybrid sensor histidine kinase/response regulator [Beggiatoa leptomitoformis]|uniref:histidine kinase n=1 Tax=Beggiatoa leptomitoformis TaxID=288004 RepID=A0A2N9YAI2_9GAMM|nr:response regulator [Beggiatoa leptomitoformis]AUI67477.1 response regulator [Beggiatoa leptomitoformis]QGX03552.1 response regulator [Beggiatoa leptomitoformis]